MWTLPGRRWIRSPLTRERSIFEQALHTRIAHGHQLLAALLHASRQAMLSAVAHPNDPRNVFGSRAAAPLLRAALHQIVQAYTLPADIQSADPFGAVKFVGRQGEHIDPQPPNIDGQRAHRLNRVGMKQNAFFVCRQPTVSSMGWMVPISLLAYIMVTRAVSSRMALFQLVRPDNAVFMHWQQGYLKALLFQGLAGCAARRDAQTRWIRYAFSPFSPAFARCPQSPNCQPRCHPR